jgi:hypothetical protein
MLAAEAATRPTTTRRSHDPDAPYLMPSIAARHRDPIICELREALVRLYFRRSQLHAPYLNRQGDILFPAFNELLRRPQDHTDSCLRRRGSRRYLPCDCPRPPDLLRRRSDGLEAVIRVLLVLASCCDWNTMEIFDPQGGYLSVSRIALLAELPCRFVEPDEYELRARYRMDTVERALQVLRTARILAFTRQHRELLQDGRHTSTAPALRKLSVNFFRKWGGQVATVFSERRAKLKKRAERRSTRAYFAGVGGDLEFAGLFRRTLPGTRPFAPATFAAPTETRPRRARESQPPFVLTDAIHEEHPEWNWGEVMSEARKRMREPPGSSSGEPPKTN